MKKSSHYIRALYFSLKVGSFNYDMSKMTFANEFVPNEEDSIKSILDYEIKIKDLR